MTSRTSSASRQLLRHTRTKRLANVVKVIPLLGNTLRFTDHDRALTFEDEVYVPVTMMAMSANQVESGMKTSQQDLYGLIDGNYVTIPHLHGNRYRGAEVRHAQIDWAMPWHWFSKHKKWIRQVTWTGSRWAASMESLTQRAQRQSGGRFGGAFHTTCPYVFGGQYCRHTPDSVAGVAVQTVIDDRYVAEFTVASWPGAFVDNFFRDGEIEWTSGANAGTVSPIVEYAHATRRCSLLVPTAFPIEVGDLGIARQGCDGLFSTCKSLGNEENFGGDPHAPSSQQIIEPPE